MQCLDGSSSHSTKDIPADVFTHHNRTLNETWHVLSSETWLTEKGGPCSQPPSRSRLHSEAGPNSHVTKHLVQVVRPELSSFSDSKADVENVLSPSHVTHSTPVTFRPITLPHVLNSGPNHTTIPSLDPGHLSILTLVRIWSRSPVKPAHADSNINPLNLKMSAS